MGVFISGINQYKLAMSKAVSIKLFAGKPDDPVTAARDVSRGAAQCHTDQDRGRQPTHGGGQGAGRPGR